MTHGERTERKTCEHLSCEHLSLVSICRLGEKFFQCSYQPRSQDCKNVICRLSLAERFHIEMVVVVWGRGCARACVRACVCVSV